MVLLKISEPSSNISFSSRNLSVGIDLGTTNSLVAVVNNGRVQTLPDTEGRHLLPSIVHYQQYSCTVGYDARKNIIKDPENTIVSVKRMIGRSLDDIRNRYPNLPYRMQPTKNGLPMILTKGGLFNPIQISSEILRELSVRVTETFRRKIDGVVITVPSYFDDAQRQGTKDAACLAGLRVLRLLNEPTAAAIAYGLDSKKEGVIVVYDLGGGTFDVSILRLHCGVFEVLATSGDTSLGGDDFDYLLANFLREKAHITSCSNSNASHIQRELLDAATAAKIALTSAKYVTVEVAGWKGNISCDKLNDLIAPLIKRTLFFCHRALKDAGVKKEEILEVVMVGGSTRIPLVREYIFNFFEKRPLTSIDPEKVVSIGAAIHADILIGNKPENEILLLDVIPLSLGIETIGGLAEKIIPRNTTIPTIYSKEFTTYKDGQTNMLIHVIQGERELVQDCRSLAKFSLCGIPSLPASKARIQVIFQVDANGILNVTAKEKTTGVEASIQVKPSYGLTEEEICTMIRDSTSYAEQDLKAKTLEEKKIASMFISSVLDRAR